jgi:hypothetical protein
MNIKRELSKTGLVVWIELMWLMIETMAGFVNRVSMSLVLHAVTYLAARNNTLKSRAALGKTLIVVSQWTAKQFWVDRQSFKQENNIYCLEKVQINKLNVYLQFKLNCEICYTYESYFYVFPIIKLN